MYCNGCQKTIPDGSLYCPFCGMAPEKKPDAPGSEAISPGMFVTVIIASLFIPLVGIIMGAIYRKGANPEKKKQADTWLWVGIAAGIFYLLVYSNRL